MYLSVRWCEEEGETEEWGKDEEQSAGGVHIMRTLYATIHAHQATITAAAATVCIKGATESKEGNEGKNRET